MAKYPFKAWIKTEYGGVEYKRAKTLEQAAEIVARISEPRTLKGERIAIVRRYVTNTRDELIAEYPAS